MRRFRGSWIFPAVVIVVLILAYFLVKHFKEGLVTSSLSSPAPIAVNSISYKIGEATNNMTAQRVWRDPHGDEVWLWQETASNDPNLIQMTAISPEHIGQTLTLDLNKNQYIWTVPGEGPMTFDISAIA
jgi:hypothetical protein